MKIVKNPEQTEQRRKHNRLVDITRTTIIGCNLTDLFNYFAVRTQLQTEGNPMIHVFPEKDSIYVYNQKLLSDAAKLARAYEESEKQEFTIYACFD
jgi:hypothetical protein